MPLPDHIRRLVEELTAVYRTRFDLPRHAASMSLEELSRAVAAACDYRGNEPRLWHLWREVQAALGRSRDESLASLEPATRRLWAHQGLRRGDDDGFVAAYLASYDEKARFGARAGLGPEYLRALVRLGRLDDFFATLREARERHGYHEDVELVGAEVQIARGEHADALERLALIRERNIDQGDAWGWTAVALAAQGKAEDALAALAEVDRLGITSEALEAALCARFQPPRFRRAEDRSPVEDPDGAWRLEPGAEVVPTGGPSPHAFGSRRFALPPCRGCGHPIVEWFTFDLSAIPPLAALLPGWPVLPLISCADCMVWMGRHDYLVDFDAMALELANVRIELQQFGEPFATQEPLEPAPAALRWRTPHARDDASFEPPAFEVPQVAGVPAWVQRPVAVLCFRCRGPMHFAAALADPAGFDAKNAVIGNGPGGYLYHFACPGCRTLSVIAQWT